MLMTIINPPYSNGELDSLWATAKEMKRDLTRAEFEGAVNQFYQQHHTLPKKMTLENVPGIDENKVKVMTKIGDVRSIWYKPDGYSRKAPNEYVHLTKQESLATDHTGKVLALYGTTEMQKDGWLHD